MALLAHPADPGTLYVAGNGDHIAWRVRWQRGHWEKVWEEKNERCRAAKDEGIRFWIHYRYPGGQTIRNLAIPALKSGNEIS